MRPLTLALTAAFLVSAATAATLTLRPPSSNQKYTGEPISINLRDADIRDVLHVFAKMTRLNIAIDPEVKGTVTLELHDVPWDQALDLMLKQNKLASKFENGVLRVTPR